MSSRDDRRRRDRSWERDDSRDRDRKKERDKRASDYRRRRDSRSRSRSPRHGDRDGRSDRRGYDRDADSRRGHDRRDDRRRDDRRSYDKVERRDLGRRPLEMGLDPSKESKSIRLESDRLKNDWDAASKIVRLSSSVVESTSTSKVEDASEDAQVEPGEEQEVIETNETDTDMMALMGFGGFDTTKGKPVQGNQEGAVDIKKQRTWRQYMNRRGGFNRPLDKIK